MSVDQALRAELETKKAELTARLQRITANLRRGYDSDSQERAKEMEDSDVVDALGNEAREELSKISAALGRIDAGRFGICVACGSEIAPARLTAYAYADECIDCAEIDQRQNSRL